MRVHKLTSVDGFVVFDLDDAAVASGPVRHGEKIIVASATELARSTTYAYALLEQPRSGASGAVNSPPDGKAAAVEAFFAEVAALPFLPEPGRGVELPVRVDDPRRVIDRDAVAADCAMAALTAIVPDPGDLRIAIEGFSTAALPLAERLRAAGASIVAVAGDAKAAFAAEGLSADRLREIASSGGGDDPANRIFGADADVLFAGSKLGVLGDVASTYVTAKTVIPTGPAPFTAKAHANLRKAGVEVVADFAVAAGALAAQWSVDADPAAIVGALVTEAREHDDGPYLAACYRAEAFLRTWQAKQPFGRPFAS